MKLYHFETFLLHIHIYTSMQYSDLDVYVYVMLYVCVLM